ncbi:hypothetical protein OTU49_012273, partial [Cherax quadricarinatus]
RDVHSVAHGMYTRRAPGYCQEGDVFRSSFSGKSSCDSPSRITCSPRWSQILPEDATQAFAETREVQEKVSKVLLESERSSAPRTFQGENGGYVARSKTGSAVPTLLSVPKTAPVHTRVPNITDFNNRKPEAADFHRFSPKTPGSSKSPPEATDFHRQVVDATDLHRRVSEVADLYRYILSRRVLEATGLYRSAKDSSRRGLNNTGANTSERRFPCLPLGRKGQQELHRHQRQDSTEPRLPSSSEQRLTFNREANREWISRQKNHASLAPSEQSFRSSASSRWPAALQRVFE